MQNEYVAVKKTENLPRIPQEGNLDITHRCNNDCRHCWLRIPSHSAEKKQELTFKEIKSIIDEARSMGCRNWFISGGEPMLRPDFAEIFDYITHNSNSCSINTNGTLITPKIARLMKRKGRKMVALYGATAYVHDHITRNPGSFEATMAGFRYLKEAGAGFIVQLVPMKDNYHQFKKMLSLAESLSQNYRIGAPWLYLYALGDKKRNVQIIRQRLTPKEVIELDKPDLSCDEHMEITEASGCCSNNKDENGHLFASCIRKGLDFHIDPYGKMTFCSFVVDPALRYDLKKGNFKDCWEKFIPSLARKIKIDGEYKRNCASCGYVKDCFVCPAYSYLEHRRYGKRVEYLCGLAQENKKFKLNWLKDHRRYFSIADMTIQFESDLPIQETTFNPKFGSFKSNASGKDMIAIRHHFSLADFNDKDLGEELYRKPPWAIYKKNDSWVYLGISPKPQDKSLRCVAVFNHDHTRGNIYNYNEDIFKKGNLHSLTFFPSDQILLARVLADRDGCYLHSCGVNFEGKGLLFVGHSSSGKSTMATMLKGKAEILCDDRMIIRKSQTVNSSIALGIPFGRRKPQTEFKIYGTWSHGDVPDVSGNSAPLKAILFLEKSKENRLIAIEDKKLMARQLISFIVRPFVTVDWWDKMISLIEKITQEVPCYKLKFDKSGRVINILRKF